MQDWGTDPELLWWRGLWPGYKAEAPGEVMLFVAVGRLLGPRGMMVMPGGASNIAWPFKVCDEAAADCSCSLWRSFSAEGNTQLRQGGERWCKKRKLKVVCHSLSIPHPVKKRHMPTPHRALKIH